MKSKVLFTALLLIFFASAMKAQRAPIYSDRYHTSYHYNNNHRYVDRSYDRYDRYYRYFDRMDRYDRKQLNKLIRRLDERKLFAWEDGHLSRREIRRIQDVEYDIERLISQYKQPRRGYRNRNGCR